mgnify:CR=1 FL=1
MAKSRGSTGMVAMDDKWKVEGDLRTLQDACAINKDPKRLKAAQALAKEKLMEMAQVAGEYKE